jgi:hypothetical protein
MDSLGMSGRMSEDGEQKQEAEEEEFFVHVIDL